MMLLLAWFVEVLPVPEMMRLTVDGPLLVALLGLLVAGGVVFDVSRAGRRPLGGWDGME